MPTINGWKIPITLLIFLIIQILTTVWWASTISTKQQYIIEQLASIKCDMKERSTVITTMKQTQEDNRREVAMWTVHIKNLCERLTRLENVRQ